MLSNIIEEKLSVGLIISNYRELCNMLELEIKTGNSKISQMAEIERFVKFKKEGYKFIVIEIYEIPLPSKDKRAVGGKAKYDKLMDYIIINLLLNSGGEIEESYTNLLDKHFNFFTQEYKKLHSIGYAKYAKINNISKGLVMEYQQKMYGAVKGCLETSLKRLRRNNIIQFEENTIVIDKNLKKGYADKKMLKKIDKYEKKVYEEMEIIPFNRSTPSINSEFKSKVCNYTDITRYWKVLSFGLINNDIEKSEEDSDELVRRFVRSTSENTKNKKSKNELTGEEYRPYSSQKYEISIDKLTKLLWKLPKDYKTKYDEEQEMYCQIEELFGNYDENIPF